MPTLNMPCLSTRFHVFDKLLSMMEIVPRQEGKLGLQMFDHVYSSRLFKRGIVERSYACCLLKCVCCLLHLVASRLG
jgi:hypothetical protein